MLDGLETGRTALSHATISGVNARGAVRPAGSSTQERAALVGLGGAAAGGVDAERSLDELSGLAEAAGARVVARALQGRSKPDPATFLGRGKLEALGRTCADAEVDLVIFDHELSPAQLRNIEAILDRKVLDRTELILDIFARRARTREGKLQVELAQLRYLLPRLVGAGAALSRLGGGIGTRGPGETKLETDRRRIRRRIGAISREIDLVRRRRTQLRERRQKREVPTVALVGYTNAGKTTLFNRLTGHEAEASDALFVTLDPLVRRVRLSDRRELLLSDTVGFLDRLPHTLVAAFRATLEEVAEADLLLHVVDASSDDRVRQEAAVRSVLREVEADEVPMVLVFNKCDRLGAEERRRLSEAHPGALCVSALAGEGTDELIDAIAFRLSIDLRRVTLEFDGHGEEDRLQIANLYRHARVLRHLGADGRIVIDAEVPEHLLTRLAQRQAGGTVERTRVGTSKE
jgi:GTPase